MANILMSPNPTHAKSPAATRRVPVTLDDLRVMEEAMFQNADARFTTTQRVFFEALLSHPTLDVIAAANICSIKPKKAAAWVAQPTVQAALNHLLTARMQKLGLNKDSLLAKIVNLLEMSMGEAPIIKSGYDKETQTFTSQSVKETDLSAAARFTDQLSKHFQLYAAEGTSGLNVSLNLVMGDDTNTEQPELLVATQGLTSLEADDSGEGDFD